MIYDLFSGMSSVVHHQDGESASIEYNFDLSPQAWSMIADSII